MPDSNLVNIPTVQRLESLSSWISRAALSQGTRVRVLARHFEISIGLDIDFDMPVAKVHALLTACGQPQDSFALARLLYANLRRVERDGGNYIVRLRRRARYRFCPRCLAQGPTPYFPVHWRFVPWRWCPEHDCLLVDSCPACKKPILLPIDMMCAGPTGEGIGLMSFCMSCGFSLSQAKTIGIAHVDLTEWERATLRNGRAFAAALLVGYVQLAGSPKELPLRQLRILEKQGAFPRRFDWLTSDRVTARSILNRDE